MTDAVQYSHEKIRSRFADPIFILLLILLLHLRWFLNLTSQADVSLAVGAALDWGWRLQRKCSACIMGELKCIVK